MPLQFNTAYYLNQNPDVADAVDAGTIPSAKWHFTNYGAAEGRNPNATFNTAYYLDANPDVAEAAAAGIINPFDHFLQYGAAEGRAPNAALAVVAANFDEEEYLAANEDVDSAVESGVFVSGYQHWVLYGRYEDRPEATYNGGIPVSSAQDTSELTEALITLQAAQTARTEFLASLDLDEDPETATTEQDVRANLNEAQQAVEAHVGTTGASLNVLRANVQDREEALATAEANLSAEEGLADAKANLEAREDAFENALEADAAAARELNGELARVDTLNAAPVALVPANTTEGFNALVETNAVVTVGGESAIVLGAGGQLEAAAGFNTSTIEGFDDLLADAQARYNAAVQVNAAEENFEAAITAVLDIESPEWDADAGTATLYASSHYYRANEEGTQDPSGTEIEYSTNFEANAPLTDAVFNAEVALEDEQALVEEREALIAERDEAQALVDQLAALDTAIEESTAAFEELGYEAPVTVEGDVSATAESDIFLFSQSAGSISGFGAEGEDLLFVGDDYTRMDLAEDADLSGQRLGDANVQEVFVQQVGNDTVLSFEEVSFAGNAAGGFEGTAITLSGVNAADVQFENGYIQTAQAVEIA